MEKINELRLTVDARSINEGFCRVAAAAFIAELDPTIEELCDVKTAVSEAVTNCVVHAYREKPGKIYINAVIYGNGTVKIRVKDAGCGIEDVEKAKEPLFTTMGDERSGLGFSVMESFSDKLTVRSKPGSGTTVTIEKRILGMNYGRR
ncbi:MAG: anti-sigma F factor [Oscillospiraceae bacterium]|nr:anti-sigma F factor [Oscillospiraceae bacterium]